MIVTVEIHLCDLCDGEEGKENPATHQYSHPDLLDGDWFDGCKKHTDEMRDAGGYTIRKIKKLETREAAESFGTATPEKG